MSKKRLTIADSVLREINTKKITMRPRWYFVMGALLLWGGLITSITLSIFIVGLYRFAIRSQSPMAQERISYLLSSFPWWIPLLGFLSLIIGIYLLHKYEFSYKVNYPLLIIIFVTSIIGAGVVSDFLGIPEQLTRRGPMRGIMREYRMQNNSTPTPRFLQKGKQEWRNHYSQ